MNQFIQILALIGMSFLGSSIKAESNDFDQDLKIMMCGNNEHLAFLNINKSQCMTAFQRAMDICGKTYLERTQIEIYDPVCITNRWVENIKVSKDKVLICDTHWESAEKWPDA